MYNYVIDILKLLYQVTRGEGGDGSAIYLSKYTSLSDIIKYIQSLGYSEWTVINNGDDYILWGDNQEWVVITQNEEKYNESRGVHLIAINY